MTEDWGAILVVDDDAEMRELVHDVFKERGHQVTTAASGQEAELGHVAVPGVLGRYSSSVRGVGLAVR